MEHFTIDETIEYLEGALNGEGEGLQHLGRAIHGGIHLPGLHCDRAANLLDPEAFRAQGLIEYAAAVRVALAYGDLSGLEFYHGRRGA